MQKILLLLCWQKSENRGKMGIPVAGATLPVVACGLVAVYGRNPILFIGAVILGIGHMGIHLNHRKELKLAVAEKEDDGK